MSAVECSYKCEKISLSYIIIPTILLSSPLISPPHIHTHNVSVTQACSYPRAFAPAISVCLEYVLLSSPHDWILLIISVSAQVVSSERTSLTTMATSLSTHTHHPLLSLTLVLFTLSHLSYRKISHIIVILLIAWIPPLECKLLEDRNSVLFTILSSIPSSCLAQCRCPINIWWENKWISGKTVIKLWPHSLSPTARTTASWPGHHA